FTYPSPDPAERYSFTVTATYVDGDGPASTSSDLVPTSGRFADVPGAAWYADGVDWTTAYGVLSAYPPGLFKPTKAATRAQVASALWNLAGRPAALAGRLLRYDALGARLRSARLPRDPDCPVCGRRAG
ncbi:MAG TPA: S-layer homology domain-containing protein, partial [Plasticicumulans sp.]|nr:S-layer homology domain-containing protein [Plasticicumulans sp.]